MKTANYFERKLAEIDEALKTAKRGTQKQSLLIRRAAIEKEMKQNGRFNK